VSFHDKLLKYKAESKVYIIAELGSNWKTHENLYGAITLAKACGADAVKYQYFTSDELYGPTYKLDNSFPLEKLHEKCKATEIDFLCTAFSVEGYERVNPFVDAHKVASSEMSHIRLLDALKKFGKPILLSTGAQGMADVHRAMDHLSDRFYQDVPEKQKFRTPVIPIHCNVSYPAKFVDVRKFLSVAQCSSGLYGFSDHTTSIDVVPAYFREAGVVVYEKHFNPFDFTDTPDAPHSLNRDEFKAFVQALRGDIPEYSEENVARLQYVRRVVATSTIKPGDTLKEGVNIGIFRSKKLDANGLNPFGIGALDGKTATRALAAGDGVSLSDIA
jgi:sialic acid synthase SpsE